MGSCSVPHLCTSLFRYYSQKYDSHLSPAAAGASQSQPPRGKLRVVLDNQWPKSRMLCKPVNKSAKGRASFVSFPEKQLGDEIISEEELMGLVRLGGDKCKEVRGTAELLECLESEAVMGADEGKEPIDYNRRARIFDTSSRVFLALKHDATNPS